MAEDGGAKRGRRNALQLLLEAQDEEGTKVRPPASLSACHWPWRGAVLVLMYCRRVTACVDRPSTSTAEHQA